VAKKLPTGTVTLLCTDIEGSTGLVGRLGGDWARVLEEHRGLIRGAVESSGGMEIDCRGDEMLLVFVDAAAAVEAIKGGAKEYIPLPPDAALIGAILAAVADDGHQMIFEDKAMATVIALAEQVAPSEASILITGESGTGKEVVARHVHRKSSRADKPFISINCAAIPDNLLESELFGHEKGAFTGAVARRVGKFEEADGGTLLLDEISEISSSSRVPPVASSNLPMRRATAPVKAPFS